MKIKSKLVNKDLALGAFAQAIERYYNSWSTLIARSFVAGLFTALGATVGLALVLALTGAILGWLGVIPVVGGFFARLNEVISHALPTLK
ncbi:hypothetical protein A2810_02780 [candidate division Kazan bacterium RIFCSPHIGHO2_01_FULL_49_10]|uniref:Uncharacterized protein n=1 Tax=candidate division Kazan bacterium RIFCSPLOWO2_01_FULL_48_13 TaxID=1798539 RepID=A0A1F4PP94_UNCK3|nr:MAG: hypothetical protein A2810_02780 [candidate division Kazan bacterium RIFCSPHIGHO2_01_FULL_49_10]OGB84862.1 MAG: hypothetical protein A2994_01605 [candidate division Kazan bacterium RIFCSPLOWO2_01_FULL_48_13]